MGTKKKVTRKGQTVSIKTGKPVPRTPHVAELAKANETAKAARPKLSEEDKGTWRRMQEFYDKNVMETLGSIPERIESIAQDVRYELENCKDYESKLAIVSRVQHIMAWGFVNLNSPIDKCLHSLEEIEKLGRRSID